MNNMKELCTEMAFLAESYLNLKKWGFQENVRSDKFGDSKAPLVIYNSQFCRVKISFNEWHPPYQTENYTINVYYGRLNAPDEKNVVTSGNVECHCWHGITKPLHFLDDRTPEYTVQNLFSHDLIKKFSNRLSSDNLPYKLPEWEIRKHAYIWEEYAPRLFELFDLQRTELWKNYQLFLKAVYDIKGRSPNIKPPMDSVC